MGLIKKETQTTKILKVLQEANGGWICGSFFLHEMYLSQYHARIWELQKQGYKIEVSDFKDENGFKSYRLAENQPNLSPKSAPGIEIAFKRNKPEQTQLCSTTSPY
jgi:hypothetical protein